jgi:hypothetical protein
VSERSRRAVTIEPVVEATPGRRLVYDVVSGIPVRNHRATVELNPSGRGTEIEWRASFDRTLRGRLMRGLVQRIYGEVVNGLVVAAEATAGEVPR